MRIQLISGLAFLLLLGTASAGDVLVYTGDGAVPDLSGFESFGAATGKAVHYEASLPTDLSVYDCVILPTNVESFTDATLDALNTYTNSGGRLIAQAEHNRADGKYLGAIDNMNAVAANLGSDLSLVGGYLDCGFNVTTNIHPSPFTEGVGAIKMACTSEVAVAVGPNAHSLVGTPTDNITFIGADKIGDGAFFLLGDGNTLSDNSSDAYTAFDNGVLAANICDLASFEIEVAIDIKFCSDPNAFNCKKKGVLPVTIFGSGALEVVDIDPSTLRLCLSDLSDCTGAPKDYSMADRGDPNSDLGASQCALVEDPPLSGIYVEQDYLTLDGLADLDAAFDANEAQEVLGVFCDGPKNGVSPDLVVIGETFDGVPIYSVPVSNAGIDQLVKVN